MTALRSRRRRQLIALLVGAVAAVLAQAMFVWTPYATDYHYWGAAGAAVLLGENPYQVIGNGRPINLDGPFAYPLPAALVAIPFAVLPHALGRALFVGLGFALAAYGCLVVAPWRLVMLAGFPALWTLVNAQWTPLLVGASLVPSFGFLLACKPTVGFALWCYRPSRSAFAGGVAICLLALAVLPTWPLDWLAVLRDNPYGSQYVSPIALPGGFLLALALFRWRLPEARLVLAMAMIPQNYFFYDQLPLLFVPRTERGLLGTIVWVWLVRALAVELVHTPSLPDPAARSLALSPFVLWGIYLPCLVMLLKRPNEGPVPPWLERLLEHLPTWLRGRSRPDLLGTGER
jgi:hypothetical protein